MELHEQAMTTNVSTAPIKTSQNLRGVFKASLFLNAILILANSATEHHNKSISILFISPSHVR